MERRVFHRGRSLEMHTIVFCLEEPSAWEMLQGILPQLLPENVQPRAIVFEGKSDLDKRLVKRIRGWQQPNSHFLVLRDKDSSDCHQLKKLLLEKTTEAGQSDAVVRIACHELESFYLGDLQAVESGLELSGVKSQQERAKYRSPDDRSNAAEEMAKLTNSQYQKIAGSRAIAPHLSLDGRNKSRSFNVLISGIRKTIGQIAIDSDDKSTEDDLPT